MARAIPLSLPDPYQIIESVERKDGMVSIVVITALRTMTKDTQTLKANAALLEEGSSSSRKNFLFNGFYSPITEHWNEKWTIETIRTVRYYYFWEINRHLNL